MYFDLISGEKLGMIQTESGTSGIIYLPLQIKHSNLNDEMQLAKF